jgi:hypothetical protein
MRWRQSPVRIEDRSTPLALSGAGQLSLLLNQQGNHRLKPDPSFARQITTGESLAASKTISIRACRGYTVRLDGQLWKRTVHRFSARLFQQDLHGTLRDD